MKSDNLVVLVLSDELHVAGSFRPARYGPFERPECCVKDFNVFFAEFSDGSFFRQAAAAVLQRSEDGGGDVVVVGQLFSFAAQTTGK